MASDYRYYNKNGKLVTGTASWIHQISKDGGLEEHYDKIVRRVIRTVIDDITFENANPIAKEIRKKRGA